MDLYDGLEEDDEKKPQVFVEDSLYGDLLDERAVISKEPVKYDVNSDKKSNLSSALRFQPRKKQPTIKSTKQKSYTGPSLSIDGRSSSHHDPLPDKTFTFGNEKHPYWDGDYDPSKPNIFEDFAGSEEQLNEAYDWQDYLAGLALGKVEFVRSQDTAKEDDKIHSSEEDSDNESDDASTRGAVLKSESFAVQLLKKYGWKPGRGLGSNQSGISKALKFVPSKKRPGTGRIIDKNRNQSLSVVSSVVKLEQFCIDSTEDDELPTKLGEECETKFGRVQQVYIQSTGDVFIKFTNAMSALRMISTRDQLLNHTTYKAALYEESKFDKNIFD